MSWTLPKDIEDRWVLSQMLPADTKLQVFIDDVERQYKKAFKDIDNRIQSNELDIAYVKQVVASIIIEFLITGGKPYSQESQSYTGVSARSVSMSLRYARVSLVLTDDDLAKLAGAYYNSAILTIKITPTSGRSWEDGGGI